MCLNKRITSISFTKYVTIQRHLLSTNFSEVFLQECSQKHIVAFLNAEYLWTALDPSTIVFRIPDNGITDEYMATDDETQMTKRMPQQDILMIS